MIIYPSLDDYYFFYPDQEESEPEDYPEFWEDETEYPE